MKKKSLRGLTVSFALGFMMAFPVSAGAAEPASIEVSFEQDWYDAGDMVTAEVFVRNAEFNTAGFSVEYNEENMTAVTSEGKESDQAAQLITVENPYDEDKDTGYFSPLSRKADLQNGKLSAALYVNPMSENKTAAAGSEGIQIATLHFKMIADGKPSLTFAVLEGDADFSQRSFFILNNSVQPEGAKAEVVYQTTGAGILTGIEVTKAPDKVTYQVGDKLDTKGMIVTASYESGRKKTVTDYTVSDLDSSKPGEKTITVTYEQKTAEFKVMVADAAAKPHWVKDSKGWRYHYEDGTYPASCWKFIEGKWYYFDQDGYRKSGWILDGKTWYYCNADGVMQTDWIKLGNTWYYLKGNGAMVTGWIQLGNTWYYLKGNGAMVTGWIQLGNTWYYLKGNGAMATGWCQVGNTWYYLKGSGAMVTGWLKLGNTWYYLKSSGAMVTGWLKLGNTWYYLKGSGAMATGWCQVGKTWYYLRSSGAMASNTWIGNYYVNGSGAWTKTR
jgi:glucan-binding YG repeat protein